MITNQNNEGPGDSPSDTSPYNALHEGETRLSRKKEKDTPRVKPTDDEDTKLSKTLTWILRRNARKIGLAVSEDDWVSIADLAATTFLKELGVDEQKIRDHAAACTKQRFEIEGDKIRASSKRKLEEAADGTKKGKGGKGGRGRKSDESPYENRSNATPAIDMLFARQDDREDEASNALWKMLKGGQSKNPPPPPPSTGASNNPTVQAMFAQAAAVAAVAKQNQSGIGAGNPLLSMLSGNISPARQPMMGQMPMPGPMGMRMPGPQMTNMMGVPYANPPVQVPIGQSSPPASKPEVNLEDETRGEAVIFGEDPVNLRYLSRLEMSRAIERGALYCDVKNKKTIHLLLYPKTVPENLVPVKSLDDVLES